MSKTVGEYKKDHRYNPLSVLIFPKTKGKFHNKLIKGLMCLVWMKGGVYKSKLELFNATGELERKFDEFYIKYNYSQFYSWEETMEVLLVSSFIKELDKGQYNEKSVYEVLNRMHNETWY